MSLLSESYCGGEKRLWWKTELTAHTNCALLVNITVDGHSCPGILLYSSYLELFLHFLRALKSVMGFLVSQGQE